jgi:hypothetical protein
MCLSNSYGNGQNIADIGQESALFLAWHRPRIRHSGNPHCSNNSKVSKRYHWKHCPKYQGHSKGLRPRCLARPRHLEMTKISNKSKTNSKTKLSDKTKITCCIITSSLLDDYHCITLPFSTVRFNLIINFIPPTKYFVYLQLILSYFHLQTVYVKCPFLGIRKV